MEQVTDWPLLWRQLVEAQASGLREKKGQRPEHVWAARARRFGDHVKKRWEKEESSRNFLLDQLSANPGSSVLDIGAGTGSWACMLAPYARRVTALERSSAMIAAMEENVRRLALTNVDILDGSWPEAAVQEHDYTVCAHAMYENADLPAFIRRIHAVTRRCCLLLMRAPVPDGVMAEIALEVWGQPHDSPNFYIAYNILLEMGIHANVIMDSAGPWKPWTGTSIEEALVEVKRKLGLAKDNPHHDADITRILENRLMWRQGKLVWPAGVRSALVYWFKES